MIKKERQSNFELLRIIALFFVLIFHSNFHTLGYPTPEAVVGMPLQCFSEFVVQGLTVICVNVFVLLSGWFGIRPTLKGACNIIYIVLFFLLGSYILALLFNRAEFSIPALAECLMLDRGRWFVKAYLGLYILAPILNKFAETAERKQFKEVLIAFFCFQTIFGWMVNAAYFFEYGFSTMSFIGLYMLARYVRRFQPKWSEMSKWADIGVYFGIILFGALLLIGLAYIPQVQRFYHTSVGHVYAYSSPLVIIESLFLLLFFSKLRFQSKIINFIAASSFSVLFIHGNPYILPYQDRVLDYYANNPYIVALIKVVLLAFLALNIALVLDQIRKLTWKWVSKIFF